MNQERFKTPRRLSIITDLIIFILVLIIVTLFIDIFNLDFKIFTNEYEELAFISDENIVTENIQEENIYYIDKIKSKYNISVNYGKNTKSYANKVSANIQTNEVIVNNNLKLLIKALEKYPQDLFKVISDSNYSISILLVDSFNNDNLALASRNNLNEYKIYLSNNSKFERALHHEMYHVLEYYMNSLDIKTNENWYLLNPIGFEYDSDISKLNKEFVYYSNLDLKNSYFVSKYSKVSDKEDRAETFAEVMALYQTADYLNEGEHIYYKVIFILNNIRRLITDSPIYIDKLINY